MKCKTIWASRKTIIQDRSLLEVRPDQDLYELGIKRKRKMKRKSCETFSLKVWEMVMGGVLTN